MIQLFSQPGDFWSNQWLLDSYPGFRGEVEAGLNEIFATAHRGLIWKTRLFCPEKVHTASNSMAAAVAGFVSELLGDEKYVRPYRWTVFEWMGAKLRTYNSTDRGAPGDKKTTDNWTRELGLEGWYGGGWRSEKFMPHA